MAKASRRRILGAACSPASSDGEGSSQGEFSPAITYLPSLDPEIQGKWSTGHGRLFFLRVPYVGGCLFVEGPTFGSTRNHEEAHHLCGSSLFWEFRGGGLKPSKHLTTQTPLHLPPLKDSMIYAGNNNSCRVRRRRQLAPHHLQQLAAQNVPRNRQPQLPAIQAAQLQLQAIGIHGAEIAPKLNSSFLSWYPFDGRA